MPVTFQDKMQSLYDQYQNGDLSRSDFINAVKNLKTDFPQEASTINNYLSCFENSPQTDECLLEIVSGKASLAPTIQNSKARFYNFLSEAAKKDSHAQKSLNEIITFVDKHNIPYASLIGVLEGYKNKEYRPDVSFEQIVPVLSQNNIRKILLQCLCFVAIKRLQQSPALTPEQEANLPKSLQSYYKTFETEIADDIQNWRILPGPGMINTENSMDVGRYSPTSNTFSTPDKNPLPSLNRTIDLETIYHELFHAHQDKIVFQQTRLYIENHGDLIGRICVLRVKGFTSSDHEQDLNTLKQNDQQRLQNKNVTADGQKNAMMYWDWSFAILCNTVTPEQQKQWFDFTANHFKKVSGKAIAQDLFNLEFETIANSFTTQLGTSPIATPQVAGKLLQLIPNALKMTDESVNGLFEFYNIDPQSSTRDQDILKIFTEKAQKYLDFPQKYTEHAQGDQQFLQHVLLYMNYRARRVAFLAIRQNLIDEFPAELASLAESQNNLPNQDEEYLEYLIPICELYTQISISQPTDGL